MDIDNLLISQEYSTNKSTVEVITQVTIRKPYKTDFVRVHPDEKFSFGPVAIYEDHQYRCTYLVDKGLITLLGDYFSPAVLVTTISKQGALFLWPLKLPKINGRDNAWYQTAREAAEMAKENWLKILPDHSLKKYKVTIASGDLGEPKWPALTIDEIMEKILIHNYIGDENHPVIQRLQGRI